MSIFFTKIPESLLPFPKDIIEQASNMVAEFHHENGNKEAVNAIQACSVSLWTYSNDEESLLEAVKIWNNPEARKTLLPSLKKMQETWIASQGNFNF